MSLFDLLPKEEKNLIDCYRQYYGDYDLSECTREDLSYVMRFWSKSKEFLYKVLGEKFIVTENISFSMSEDDLKKKFNEAKNDITNPISKFRISFYDKLTALFTKNIIDDNQYYFLKHLFDSNQLVANKCYFNTSIKFPNDKKLTISIDDKLIKVLSKISNAYEIEGFEDFRLEHSRILNNKKTTGKLCLSIHPLDYMTMSDNDCGWSSCMSWQDGGCYRQGTIEMMNSESVIVAYLESENSTLELGSNRKWNSKKWRELFVVNDDFIAGVKGYPYQHAELEEIVIKKIQKLLETNTKYKYSSDINYYRDNNIYKERDFLTKIVRCNFATTNMYNDFGTRSFHPVILSKDFDNKEIYYNYSGMSECINCGCTNPDCYDGSDYVLVCAINSQMCCCECGESIEEGYEYYNNSGECFCEACYNDIYTQNIYYEELERERAVEVHIVNTDYNIQKQIDNNIYYINMPMSLSSYDVKRYNNVFEREIIKQGFYTDARDIFDEVVVGFYNSEVYYIDYRECNQDVFNYLGFSSKEKYEEIIKRYYL